MADDESIVFRQKFSQALAQALVQRQDSEDQQAPAQGRARDGGGQRQEPSQKLHQLAQETYCQLQFDDPIGLTLQGCQALSEALLLLNDGPSKGREEDPTADRAIPSLTLSPRLINGLNQALYRYQQPLPTSPPHTTTDTSTKNETTTPIEEAETNTSSLLLEPNFGDPTSLSLGLSVLAWTVFGRIPLQILAYHASPHPLLGTYRASPRNRNLEDHRPVAAAATTAAPASVTTADVAPSDHRPAALLPPTETTVPLHNTLDDSHGRTNGDEVVRGDKVDDDEIWADESDPSDYSYGNSALDHIDHGATGFGATDTENNRGTNGGDDDFLSSLPGNATVAEPLTTISAAHAITSLLQQISYRNLSHLPFSSSATIHDELIQLALTLLVVPEHNNSNTKSGNPLSSSLEEKEEYVASIISSTTILNAFPIQHWQTLALKPIHFLRDMAAVAAVMDEDHHRPQQPSQPHHHCAPYPAYLTLIQAMIQIHRVQSSHQQPQPSSQPPPPQDPFSSHLTTINNTNDYNFHPATWLGLSLLSDECVTCYNVTNTVIRTTVGSIQRTVRLEQLQNCIVESMDELVLLLETACNTTTPTTTTTTGQKDHPRIATTEEESTAHTDDTILDTIVSLLAPMLRILCVPRVFGSTSVVPGAGHTPSSSSKAFQLLLNSGWYRQWLLIWQRYYDSYREEAPTTPLNFEHDGAKRTNRLRNSMVLQLIEDSLLELCVASPKLLGKYARRFPGFAASRILPISSSLSSDSQQSNMIEWCLVACELASLEVESGSTAMQWRPRHNNKDSSSSPTHSPPPTLEACQCAARNAFDAVLECLVELVSEWKDYRTRSDINDSNHRKTSSSSPRAKDDLQDRQQQQLLESFGVLVDRLLQWPLLCRNWLQLERTPAQADTDKSHRDDYSLRDHLLPLQRLLNSWPRHVPPRTTSPSQTLEAKAKKLDDFVEGDVVRRDTSWTVTDTARTTSEVSHNDSNATAALAVPLWKQSAQDNAIEQLRRSLKTLLSLLDSSAEVTHNFYISSSSSSRMSSTRFSSKAD